MRKRTILILTVITGLLCLFYESSFALDEKISTKKQVERGRYLVIVGGCNDCHSPKILTPKGPVVDMERRLSGHPADEKLPEIPKGIIGPDKWGGLFTHGLTSWVGPWGVSYSANLTPDKDTGLGLWSEDLFIQTIRGGTLLPPMPWEEFAQMPDEDLKAIFAYLKTLKPIKNQVPPERLPGKE